MIRKKLTILGGLALTVLAATLISATPKDDGIISREDGMTVVNTTELGKKVVGYVDATPLKIFIKKNKIVKIEALKNQETPKYFAKVKKQLLPQYEGRKVSDVLKQQVDGVTGATFSSDAVKENVRLGLEYYQKNK